MTSSQSLGSAASAEVERRGEVVRDRLARRREAGVFQAQRQLGRPLAGDRQRRAVRRLRLPVGVPDPRHVGPVGDPVVERDEQVVPLAGPLQRAQRLIHAGGILAEQDAHSAAVNGQLLLPAEGGAVFAERRADRLTGDAQRAGGSARSQRVVDAVETLRRQLDATRRRCTDSKIEVHPLVAFGHTVGGDFGRRAARTGAGVPVAEVREEAVVVVEVVTAGRIPERVGDLRLGGGADARVGDPEAADRPAGVALERADQRVIDVQHDFRCGIERLERTAPTAGDRVDLAVAIELVAHEVGKQHDAGPGRRRDLVERGLIGLKHRDAARRQMTIDPAGVNQRAEHAAHQI